MRDAWRPAAALACMVLAAGGAAEAAHAGVASGRPAAFKASADERNAVTVDRTSSGEVRFSDAVTPIVPGLFCLPIPLGQAVCDPDGDARDTDGGGVSVDLGDRDDRVSVLGLPGTGGRPGSIRVTGGPGKDSLENSAFGVIRFEGGAGDDTLVTGMAANAVLIGGTGADLTAATGLCCATSYEDHERGGVRVTLDGKPNDGAPNEHDDVQTPAVIGSPGPDVIIGDGGVNSLTGGAGADVLDGGGGDDMIDASLSPVLGTDGVDTVTCGSGTDDVTADANDKVAVDCEQVRVGQGSGPELVLRQAAVRASRTGAVTLTYRAGVANPGPAALTLGSARLVDRKGRPVSSGAPLVLSAGATVARLRVALDRATRRRLSRARGGRLVVVAQRTYRDGAAPGYTLFNAPLTVRRAR